MQSSKFLGLFFALIFFAGIGCASAPPARTPADESATQSGVNKEVPKIGAQKPSKGAPTKPKVPKTPSEVDEAGGERTATSCPFDAEKNWQKQLLIYHFYIGQGDSTFVRTPSGTTVLIDAGPSRMGREVILPIFKACGIESIDYGVLTHGHDDHFGGFVDLLRAKLPFNKAFYIPSEYIEGGEPSKWKKFKTTELAILSEMGAKHYSMPKLGEDSIVDAGGQVKFDILAVNCETKAGKGECFKKGNEKDPKDTNAQSIAQIISYKGFSYWSGGDLTGGGKGNKPDVESLVAKDAKDVDVYHSNHHGSDTSGNPTLLAALKPEFAVISAGKGARNGNAAKVGQPGDSRMAFHLPNEGALVRMSEAGVQAIYMTSLGETENDELTMAIPLIGNPKIKSDVADAQMGDVMLVSNGTDYRFFGSKLESKFTAKRAAEEK